MRDKQCEFFTFFYSKSILTLPSRIVADVYKNRFLEDWTNFTRLRKPLIAAVSGVAVGITNQTLQL